MFAVPYPGGGTPPTVPADPSPHTSWLPNTGSGDMLLVLVALALFLVLIGLMAAVAAHRRA